jgi:hypothetical protein
MKLKPNKAVNALILFPFYLFLLSCSYSLRKEDCHELHTGNFIFFAKSGRHYRIERNDSIQVEINLKTNDTCRESIEWVSPCLYKTTVLSCSADYNDSFVAIMKNNPVYSEIIAKGKDYYVFKSWVKGYDYSIMDTINILK